MTPAEARAIRDAFVDHPTYCREALTFHNQQAQWGPLELSPGGVKVCKAVRDQQLRRQPVRLLVLKPRRAFVSTTVASLGYKTVAHIPGQKLLVMGHLDNTAEELFGYYQTFASKSVPFRGIDRATIARQRLGESIELTNGSAIESATAGTAEVGRGKGPRHLHLSEYAFYAHAAQLMTGLLQSVPDDPDTSIIIETTANGMGGSFYEEWQQSEQARDSIWRRVFFGWWEHPLYRMPLPLAAADFQSTLDAEEREMQTRYRLSFEQLQWRRWAITNKCFRDKNRFYQEYPSNAEEAFLHSGRPVFDLVSLNSMPVQREAWTMGVLERRTVGTQERLSFILRGDGQAPLAVIRKPQIGRRYVLGVDTAQGIDAGGKSGRSDPDYSAVQVLDEETGEQVAVFRDRMTSGPFAQWVVDIARWYNNAFIVPESTGYGQALIEHVLGSDYPIDRIFWRDNHQPLHRAAPARRAQDFGYQTSASTKPILISTLNTAIIEQSITIQHPQTMAELRAYCTDAMGRTNAPAGDHDDLVIALALAEIGRRVFVLQVPRHSAAGPSLVTVSYRTA